VEAVVARRRARPRLDARAAEHAVWILGVHPAVEIVVDGVFAGSGLRSPRCGGTSRVDRVDGAVVVLVDPVVADARPEAELVDPGGAGGVVAVGPAVCIVVAAVVARRELRGRRVGAAAVGTIAEPVAVVVLPVVALPGSVPGLARARRAVGILGVDPSVAVAVEPVRTVPALGAVGR